MGLAFRPSQSIIDVGSSADARTTQQVLIEVAVFRARRVNRDKVLRLRIAEWEVLTQGQEGGKKFIRSRTLIEIFHRESAMSAYGISFEINIQK
jgi:hypothetical protein